MANASRGAEAQETLPAHDHLAAIVVVKAPEKGEQPSRPPESPEDLVHHLLLDRGEGSGEIEEDGATPIRADGLREHCLLDVNDVGNHGAASDESSLLLYDTWAYNRLYEEPDSIGNDAVVSIHDTQGPHVVQFADAAARLCDTRELFRQEEQKAAIGALPMFAQHADSVIGTQRLESIEEHTRSEVLALSPCREGNAIGSRG